MKFLSFGRCLMTSALAVSLAMTAATSSYAQAACSSSKDVFLNPFNKNSAHHRPIGTGAQYASDSHPATRDWLKGHTLGVNVGGPWGVDAVATSSSDPVLTVTGKNNSIGLPASVRLPRNFKTNISYSAAGSYDGVAVVHDRTNGRTHEFFQYEWNQGKPRASIHKLWDIRGLGHGTSSGQRMGTSASGVSMLFGILRGHEINKAGHAIEHVLQLGLPSFPGCKSMLGPDIKLPATARDSFASRPGYVTGNIPYGALMALPSSVNVDSLGLSEPGRRLAKAFQNFGAYVVDTGGCSNGIIRADQYMSGSVRAQLASDLPKIYKKIRMVTNNNNVLGTPVAGGGQPLAPNCAFDAGATGNVSAPQTSSGSNDASNSTTKPAPSAPSSEPQQASSSSGNNKPATGTAAAGNWDKAVQFYKWAMMGKDAMAVYKPGTAKYQHAKQIYERNIRLYIQHAAWAGMKVDANTPPERAFAGTSVPSASSSTRTSPSDASKSNTGNAQATASSSSGSNQKPVPGSSAAQNWSKAVQFHKWAMMGKDAMAVYKPGTAKYQHAKQTYERNIRLYVQHAARAGVKVNANTPPDRAFG